MDNPNNHHLPEPNPYTRDRHQRQVFWQVLFPVILGAIIIIVLAVFVSISANTQVTRLSDISIIFLILPTAVVALLVLVIFGGLIFLLAKTISVLPPYTRMAQIYLDRITTVLKKAADSAASPVMNIESMVAGLRSVFEKQGTNGSAPAAQSRTVR